MVWIWCYSKGAERSIVSRLNGRSSRFRSLMAVYCQQTCQHWWLPRATACGPPMAKGRIQTKNTSFSGFSSGLHRKNHPAAIGRILDSSRLVAIFAGLEFARLLYLQRFSGESPGYTSRQSSCPMSVHHRPANGGTYLLILLPPGGRHRWKMVPTLNR
jgi:hypothetical protein